MWSCYCPKIPAAVSCWPLCGEIPWCCVGWEPPGPLTDHLKPTAVPVLPRVLCRSCCYCCVLLACQSLSGAVLKPQSSEELWRTVTAQSAASPTASAHHPAWTWGPMAPTLVLFGGDKKLIRANQRVGTNCEIRLQERARSSCLGVELGNKVHFIFGMKHFEQLHFGAKKGLKSRGDVLLVLWCLSRAEPVPGRATIGVRSSFPKMGFLSSGTDEGSVVEMCCLNRSNAPGCLGWGRCLSKGCSSASQNGD